MADFPRGRKSNDDDDDDDDDEWQYLHVSALKDPITYIYIYSKVSRRSREGDKI